MIKPAELSRWRRRAALLGSSLLTFIFVVWYVREPAGRDLPSVQVQEEHVTPPPVNHGLPDPASENPDLSTTASVSPSVVRLQLFKTFPGATAREGTAVLGIEAANPQTYRVGSMLASGATIEEIHHNHIVLKHGTRFAKLYVAGTASPESDTLLSATTVGGPGFSDRPVETRPSSRNDTAEIFRPKLVFSEGKIAGIEVVAGRDRSRLASLGLLPGDVIRTIDGRPVSADSDWQRISQALATGDTVVLGIERDNSLMSVLMDAKQLNSGASVVATADTLPPNS